MSGYVPDPADVFAGADGSFADLKGWLDGGEAAGMDHAELEKQVGARGRELQRQLLQAHLDLREAREVRRPAVTGADGIIRTRAEKGHARTLASVFGLVTVSRIAYRAAGAINVRPADEELSLPAGKYSSGLCEKLVLAAAAMPVAGACQAVFRQTGVRIGTRQASQVIGRAAADFRSFYACRRRTAVLAEGEVLVLQPDGKGIRMRPGSLRPEAARAAAKAAPRQQGRLSRGEVRTRKRMAEAGVVYSIEPVPRTASGILGPPAGQDPPGAGGTPDAPHARDKWLTASVADDAAHVIAEIFAEADRRDPGHQVPWIALADGNKDQIARIQAEAAARGITVTVIIDIIHVSEYLWNAAWCFYPEASPDAGPWVRARLRAILNGQAADVAAAIRDRAASTAGLSGTKHKTAEKTARYLENKAPWLDYPAALAAGWPISTGVIEGACRYLVKRPHGHHRRPVEHPRRRSDPPPPSHHRQRRLGPLLGLAQTPAAPPHLPRPPDLLATRHLTLPSLQRKHTHGPATSSRRSGLSS